LVRVGSVSSATRASPIPGAGRHRPCLATVIDQCMAAETLSYAVRPRVVGIYLGQLALLVGCLSTPPLVFAAVEQEWMQAAGYLIAVVALAGGGNLLQRGHRPSDIQWNEALVVAAAIFILTPLVLAVPMMMAGLSFLDALFEAISGITTTGLSTFGSVEDKPHIGTFDWCAYPTLGAKGAGPERSQLLTPKSRPRGASR